MREAAWPGYFADPFVLPADDGYVAYGTRRAGDTDGGAFEVLTSPDLVEWHRADPVVQVDPAIGTDYWAPEVVRDNGGWWLLYSAGRGIDGHHIRVAHADAATGPFTDMGLNLTPEEPFAIDAHPFVDADGTRWLFYARDVLNAERPGTHLAVRRMRSWTEADGPSWPVLAPDADWQIYERQRAIHGRRLDWSTLEGPTVVARPEGLVLLYSGGSWEGPGYGVASAVAPSPTGPWRNATTGEPDVLSTALIGQPGPGHCSVVPLPGGRTAIAYHAWDEARERRQLHVAVLDWAGTRPVVQPDDDLAAARPVRASTARATTGP